MFRYRSGGGRIHLSGDDGRQRTLIADMDGEPENIATAYNEGDREFLFAARADVPWLVAQLRDARAENERLHGVNEARKAATRERNKMGERAARAEAALAAVRDEVDRRRPCTNCRHRASLHNIGYWGCSACDCGAFGEPPVALAAAEQDEPKRCAHGLDYPHAVDREDGYHFPEIRCPGPVSQPTEGSEQCDGCSEPNRCGCKPGAEFRLATCPACDGSGFASTYDGRDLGICSKCDGHGVSR
jgi:hypothetical protein